MPDDVALAMSLIFHLLIVLTSLPGGVLWWKEKALAPARSLPIELASQPVPPADAPRL
jgi:hypothetical protein